MGGGRLDRVFEGWAAVSFGQETVLVLWVCFAYRDSLPSGISFVLPALLDGSLHY